MQLKLTVTRHMGRPPSEPMKATFDARGGTIGRQDDKDLVLPDSELEVSREHARIEYKDGAFSITDTSSNGLMLNGRVLGKYNSARLANGDRLRAGQYEVEVTIEDDVDAMVSARGLAGGETPPDVLDLLKGGGPPDALEIAPSAPAPGEFPLHDDRTPAHAQSLPPMSEPASKIPAASEEHPPGADLGATPSSPGLSLPQDWKSHAEELDEGAPGEALEETLTGQIQRQPPAKPQPEQPEAAGSQAPTQIDDRLLSAFIKGLNISDFEVDEDDAAAVLELAGHVLREAVHGVRRVLIARGKVKETFRLPVTILQQVENNPLKFSVGVEDALEKLLERDPKGYMPPVESVREVFEDLEIHEIAVITGMRAALERVLSRFEPEALEKRLEAHFLERVVPGTRKARLWELFTEQYEEIRREARDAFDQLYGKGFAEAYEKEIRALKLQKHQSAREPPHDDKRHGSQER